VFFENSFYLLKAQLGLPNNETIMGSSQQVDYDKKKLAQKPKFVLYFPKVENHLSPMILSEYEKESYRMSLVTKCPVSG
jgi:hypothetical protein